MSLTLSILKNNAIFLLIGSHELHFVRFLKGKILSTRSYKLSYDTEHSVVKHFFKEYLSGKEGVPIAIIHDSTNQTFTDYIFPKGLNTKSVKNSINKKINHEITQEAIHDYFKAKDDKKASESSYQVLSIIKTPITALFLDLIAKFPNPIAGHFSMIIEMQAICEGSLKRIKLPKPIPVIEQDAFEMKEKGYDDLTIVIHQSPISGINFCLYQENKILFSHIIVCSKIHEEVVKEIDSTISTILDYCQQESYEYTAYISGEDTLLQSILATKLDKLSMFYVQPNISETKFFYHKKFNMNLTKGNSLDAIAFKCLYEPTFFVENKHFLKSALKHFFIKFFLVLVTVLAVFAFAYNLLSSSSSALQAFTKYGGGNLLNISKVMHDVQTMEKNINDKKEIVDFHTAFSNNSYEDFFKNLKTITRNSIEIKNLSYSCLSSCNGYNAKFEATITGIAPELQDYYSLISDLRRVFYRHEIERKVNESNGQFTVKIVTISKK